MRHALHCQGIEEENYDNLTRMIGPPLAEGFAEFYGMDEAHAWQGVRDFRSSSPGSASRRTSSIPVSGEMLERLRGAGITLAVATSKPEPLRAGHRPPL